MSEPQIALWHPMAQDEESNLSPADIARFVAQLAPFMQTYSALTVDDYWALSVSEHAAMLEWLYVTEVLERPSSEDTR